MKINKIKILTIGENDGFVGDFRSANASINEHYSFIQTDYESFLNTSIQYNVLLFGLRKENINEISSFYLEAGFENEPPVILICDEDITEKDVFKIPFKNKLAFKATSAFEDLKYNISVIIKKHELEKKIFDLESRVATLGDEIEYLKCELDYNSINIKELSQTNHHLVSATWREREIKKQILLELESVKKENEINKLNINELSATNEHLISATWRERDLKKQLKEALEDLQKSKNLIELQSKKISESINYSRRIQNVILPDEKAIKNNLSESFILYIPKDVVSGDFPFYFQNEKLTCLAAVDCTGHGVPGAMLSLIGNLSLNHILKESENLYPSVILKDLHSRIVTTLKQDVEGNDTSDGMDIALCIIDKENSIVRFAGAHRPLYHIRNNNLEEYKGTRLPIGGKQYRKEITYTDFKIKTIPGDSFYIFSDGFPDQFGGPVKEKYGPARIQEFLLSHQHLSMEELKTALKEEFLSWKGEEKQMDDILFIGFKL